MNKILQEYPFGSNFALSYMNKIIYYYSYCANVSKKIPNEVCFRDVCDFCINARNLAGINEYTALELFFAKFCKIETLDPTALKNSLELLKRSRDNEKININNATS